MATSLSANFARRRLEIAGNSARRLGVKPLGGTARLATLRDGKTLDLPLKLASAPETPPRDALTIHGRSPFDGPW